MKRIFKLFRIVTATAGILCLLSAAGTDQMYTSVGQMPPESVDKLVAWGFILLIPMALHWLKGEVGKKVRR